MWASRGSLELGISGSCNQLDADHFFIDGGHLSSGLVKAAKLHPRFPHKSAARRGCGIVVPRIPNGHSPSLLSHWSSEKGLGSSRLSTTTPQGKGGGVAREIVKSAIAFEDCRTRFTLSST